MRENIVPYMFDFQQLLAVLIGSVSSSLCLWLQNNVNMVSTVGVAHKRKEMIFLWSLWSDEISTNAEG